MRSSVAALALWAAASRSVGAQASPTVSVDDVAYVDADRLIDCGLADGTVVAQRPYSRRALARIAASALRALDARGADACHDNGLAQIAARRLVARFADTLVADGPRLHIDEVRFQWLATDAPTRAVPGNGFDAIEADVNSFLDDREGRRFVSGHTGAAESSLWMHVTDAIALSFRPRIAAFSARDSGGIHSAADILAANARIVVGNVALTAGREYTYWGTAPNGGLFFSENAPGMNMLRLSSEAPFHLPSVLGRMPVSAVLQVADLGASENHSHSRLLSYKVSVAPTNALEIGASFDNHFGGAGAKNPSALNRLFDFLPFVDIFRHHADSLDFDSDKLLGMDARLRLSQLGNITAFSELALEDFDPHRLASIFTQDAAYVFGLRAPVVIVPSVSAQFAYHTTGIRFYEHAVLRDGITANRFTLGDNIGHDAAAWDASTTWDAPPSVRLTARFAVENRSNDTYISEYTLPEVSQGFVFRRVAVLPRERRVRSTIEAAYLTSDERLRATIEGGAETTTNFNFVAAPAQTHGMLALTLSLYR